MPKKYKVCDLYKQVREFVKSAQVVHIFPIALSYIFWVFLKSIKAKYLMISLNTQSTDTRTVSIDMLKSFCSCERWLPSKGLKR